MARKQRIVLLILLTSVLAGANYALNPHRPAWYQEALQEWEITLQDALAMGPTVLWLDARSESDFSAGNISGAINLNEYRWDDSLPEVLRKWQPGQAVVVYFGSQQCRASHTVAERLKNEVGLDRVLVLKGGWESWQKHAK